MSMELLREYSVYLCVERGLRPLSVSAYITDLEQFAEFLEKTNGDFLVATQFDVAVLPIHPITGATTTAVGPGRSGSSLVRT